MDSEKVNNFEELKLFLENIQFGKVLLSEIEMYDLISKCHEQYFTKENMKNPDQLKIIFKLLYSGMSFAAGIFKYRNQYNVSAQFYKRFEVIADFAKDNNLMKLLSWIDFSYNLSYLLYHTNEDYAAINRCNWISSKYLRKTKRRENYERIIKEEDKHPKSHSDYIIYLNYLYKICNLGQLISAKTGARNTNSHFYFRQKYFLEKLLYNGEEPFYRNEFITDDLIIEFGSSKHFAVSDPKTFSKGFKRFKINFKRISKGIWLTFFRYLAGYGERPFNIFIADLLIVFLFSLIYSYIDSNSVFYFMNYFYKSLFIFTSFGIYESSNSFLENNKELISLEILLGVIFINGFIVLLTRKLLR